MNTYEHASKPQRVVKRFLLSILAVGPSAAFADAPIPVTPDNFPRAESHLYFARTVDNGGFGKYDHTRRPTPMDKQFVIRLNRDTLYSAAVFDLDAGPVTITLPDPGERFISLQIIDENHYTHGVHYQPGPVTITREAIGTRYVIAPVRILVNPGDERDVATANALQDAITIEQERIGEFTVPAWHAQSQDKVREALLSLASTLPDTKGMFGSRAEVDPVRHLIGSAMGWGGNPDDEALYLNRVPEHNDGETVHRLTISQVPVSGFWSISVYNEQGFFEPNELDAYSLNDLTAERSADGTITVQFGGCDNGVPNCLPTPANWNYMVRLYRPHQEVLDGSWQFPAARAVR